MNNLTITQDNSRVELLGSNGVNIIKKLYELAIDPNNVVTLTGNIKSNYAYGYQVDYLNETYNPDFVVSTDNRYLKIEDPEVKRVLLAASIGDGTGITETDAANANLGTIFKGNTTITSFDEFGYFTRANTSPTNEMFRGCTNLENIDLSNVTRFSNRLFQGTNITDVNAPNLVSSDASVFVACPSLQSVTSLGDLASIPDSMFWECSNLQTVNLPDNCTTISGSAFIIWDGSTGSLLQVNGIEHVSSFGYRCFLKQKMLRLTANDLANAVSIDEKAFLNVLVSSINSPKLMTLGELAFSDNAALTTIECLGKVSNIPLWCFGNDSSLLTVKIPYECTNISKAAFYRNSSLTSIKQYTDSIDNWVEGVEPTTGSLSRVTTFGDSCFEGCSLLSIDASGFTSITTIGGSAFRGAGITGTLDLTNVTSYHTNAILGSNITGLIVPNTIQNINFIGCFGLRTITADISLWTKVPSFGQSPNILPFVIYQPLVTTIDVGGMFGTGWSAGGSEKTGPSTWTQLYWPAATSAFSDKWYYSGSTDCGGLFIWSRYYLKTIDVVYFKDIQNIDYYSLQYCKIKALVINNTTVPVIQNHSRDSSTVTSNETSFINLHAETIIYVPDSAVSTYQTAWPTHTIQGISTLNSGVYYETEADWTAAGKPVGLIGEYLGLNSTELTSFVSAHNLTKWVNSNV